MDDLEGFSRSELAELMAICYRAGFIAACYWDGVVSQDVDSGAFKQEMIDFIDNHHPYENPINLEAFHSKT